MTAAPPPPHHVCAWQADRVVLRRFTDPAEAAWIAPPALGELQFRKCNQSSPSGTGVIAGSLAGHAGPGVTWTPITYVHATVSPGAGLDLPWSPEFNAMVYVLGGRGTVAGRLATVQPSRLPHRTAADTEL